MASFAKHWRWERTYLVLSLLLFLPCCAPFPCREWILEEFNSHCPEYTSAKIFLPAESDYFGLEVELARYRQEGDRMYLNVFSLPLVGNSDNPKKISVTINFAGNTETVNADLFAGGQRILVPSETAEQIINSLLQGQTLIIAVDRYQGEILPANFSIVYHD